MFLDYRFVPVLETPIYVCVILIITHFTCHLFQFVKRITPCLQLSEVLQILLQNVVLKCAIDKPTQH